MQALLLILAWLLFAAALFLPALVINPLGGPRNQTYTGLDCLLWGVYFYPSNALLILSPFLVGIARRLRSASVNILMAAIVTVSTPWVLSVEMQKPSAALCLGAHLWTISHCAMCLAWYIPFFVED